METERGWGRDGKMERRWRTERFQEDVQMDGERDGEILTCTRWRERESQFGGHRTGDDDASLKPAKVYPNHDRFTFLLYFFSFSLPNSILEGFKGSKNSKIYLTIELEIEIPGERNKGWRGGE